LLRTFLCGKRGSDLRPAGLPVGCCARNYFWEFLLRRAVAAAPAERTVCGPRTTIAAAALPYGVSRLGRALESSRRN
jgi:hypothetical protein